VSCRWGEKEEEKVVSQCTEPQCQLQGKLYIKLKEEERKRWKENWQINPKGK
jgi:hypothetical protein